MSNELISAAGKGDLAKVKALVENGAADVNAVDSVGASALYYAANICHLGIVKYLCEKGADVNHQNSNGFTPLMIALASERPKKDPILSVVEYLCKTAHANVNLINRSNFSALSIAAKSCDLLVVKYLCEKAGADVDNKDLVWWPPLVTAAQKGRLDVIKYLIEERHADVNALDGYKATALIYASRWDYQEIVEYLCSRRDTNPNVEDQWGETALMYAAKNVSSILSNSQIPRNIANTLCRRGALVDKVVLSEIYSGFKQLMLKQQSRSVVFALMTVKVNRLGKNATTKNVKESGLYRKLGEMLYGKNE